MKLLVLGGSEFVSKALAKYLIAKGYSVDILTRGIKSLGYDGYKKHIICDRKDINNMKSQLNDEVYDYVFDISAYTEEDTKIALEAINKEKLKKYIFCSSGAVYKPSNDIVNEYFTKGENPFWGQYGLDKKAAEDYIINSGINYCILRPTYIYGEGNNLYRESYFFDRILNKKFIQVPSGDEVRTQFLHIDDLVRIFESAMYSNESNEIYNVTNDEIVTWKEYINICGEVIGEQPIIKEVHSSKSIHEVRTYFPFRNTTYTLSIDKLKSSSLHVPKIGLKEGLEKTFKWYKENDIKLEDKKMINVDNLLE
ncbi:NAD-dependent epimerase/dehydratase family protein [Clostridium intestinale]|uniref:Nucleoside-diphosphate-sugar epimerase n=1 Tax=Clostridium intestinale DSM 6191 TaxID=1121320 RepID=A0A1M6BE00_9CLOT|nr:NAD-dependent epimerase/dehydratase family protein [Clostridium intestinale]SHI46788.1 Nucleoside-diphosphate-sugar epimerase [Clostridium intestinale DSM 6191]